MSTNVEGVIRNGRIELPKDVLAVEGTRVMVAFLPNELPTGSAVDPVKALEGLAEIRGGLPPMDVVEMVLEGREDLTSRSQP